MKKYIYMSCIMLMEMILGFLICKTQYGALCTAMGILTGVFFGLFDDECSKKK